MEIAVRCVISRRRRLPNSLFGTVVPILTQASLALIGFRALVNESVYARPLTVSFRDGPIVQ